MRKIKGITIVRGNDDGSISLLFCRPEDAEGKRPRHTVEYPSAVDAEHELLKVVESVRRVSKRIEESQV